MVNFENVLPILKEQYNRLQPEILRFDFQYNGYHIFFFYKPTLIKDGTDLFIFNAYVANNLICQSLYFLNDELITSIDNEIFLIFRKISPTPTEFFEAISSKIINNEINFEASNLHEMEESFDTFKQQFPKLEVEKPYFWRLTTATMSPKIETKLIRLYNLTYKEISFLKKLEKTAQFTLDPQKEKNIKIALKQELNINHFESNL
ncbi:hypothetical protein [Fusobacterium sp. THCT1E2]